MNEELKVAILKFSNAVVSLKEGTALAKNDLEKDGVIQRFEFTIELFWKTVKIYLQEQGIVTKTPKESLKSAFSIGLLKDEETMLNMLEDRNKTSHLYNKEVSEKIFQRIKNQYLPTIESVLLGLQASS